jgi:phage gp29-like protein
MQWVALAEAHDQLQVAPAEARRIMELSQVAQAVPMLWVNHQLAILEITESQTTSTVFSIDMPVAVVAARTTTATQMFQEPSGAMVVEQEPLTLHPQDLPQALMEPMALVVVAAVVVPEKLVV